MNIYIIGQKGIPARAGGIERHVEELATRLAAHGHEVAVYVRSHYTPKTMRAYAGVRLIHLPTIRSKHFDAITHTFFATLHVLTQRADIVHYHGVGPALMLWIVRLLKRNTRVVFTFHCQDYHHQKWNAVARAVLRLGESIGVRCAHRVITVSKTLTRYVWARYLRESTYIPNGAIAREEEHDENILQRFGFQETGYVLAVARLIPHKGIHELIEAFARLDTTKQLVIAGDGVYTDAYVRELRMQAEKDTRVRLIGNQDAETLAALYRNAAVVAHPSHAEGLSIALLEAMHYGACVLASDIPENQEVVRDGGYTFRTGSISDLTAKLRFILDRPDIAKQSGAALQERAQQEYAWDPIAEKTITLYEACCSERASVPAPARA